MSPPGLSFLNVSGFDLSKWASLYSLCHATAYRVHASHITLLIHVSFKLYVDMPSPIGSHPQHSIRVDVRHLTQIPTHLKTNSSKLLPTHPNILFNSVSCPKNGCVVQNSWVSWPKTWVSCPRIWVSSPISIWVSCFLGELSWYLSE